MSDRRHLFNTRDLGHLIRGYESGIRGEIEQWSKDRILGSSEADLVSYLIEKYSFDPPTLHSDQKYVEAEGETEVDVSGRWDYDVRDRSGPLEVPGQYVTIAVPFSGDPDLLQVQASGRSYNLISAEVVGNTVQFTLKDVKLDPAQVTQEINGICGRIEQHLQWVRNDCAQWNNQVGGIVSSAVQDRKRRILAQTSMVSALGLPIKRRGDAPATFAPPLARRKRPVELPAASKEIFKPEPALPDEEYDYILNVIDNLSRSIERSPSTFTGMGEEEIRDILIVSLNGHYEGEVTGETFNASGKTDILIRADGRNVFIAECKFWEGAKALLDAIDQILGYLTWRDTKAALVIFSKNVDFTNVLGQIAATIPTHPNFKRELKRVSETHTRFVFKQKADPAREIFLGVLAFNVPRKVG